MYRGKKHALIKWEKTGVRKWSPNSSTTVGHNWETSICESQKNATETGFNIR